jgi:RNA polymerase sigma-70 factor, ECF subfamily
VAPRLMGPQLRQRCRTSDLVQSALVEAIASMPAFRGNSDSEFVGWTLRIMERNALDRQRRLMAKKRRIDREQAADDLSLQALAADGHSPSDHAIDREELVRIARALRLLTDDQRRIIQIVALQGGSHADAARILQRSENACRVLLARSRAALMIALAKLDRDESS